MDSIVTYPVALLQKLVHKGNQVAEEFVETEYYKDLGCVDKQHHTVSYHPQHSLVNFFFSRAKYRAGKKY